MMIHRISHLLIHHWLARHLAFWGCYVLLTVGIYYVQEPTLMMHIVYEFASLPSKILAVYFLLYVIYPRFIQPQKYFLAIAVFTGLLGLAILSLRISIFYLVYPYFFPKVFEEGHLFSLIKMISPLLDLLIVTFSALALMLLREREKIEQQKLLLQKNHAEHELQLLKSQLHPHFLFNTLNSLYAYTLEEPSKAANMVIRLSEILRFIIYESSRNLVPVMKEINCIENYVSLERMRYSKRLKLDLKIIGESSHGYIAPLILLPFVENSFKHGGSSAGDISIKCLIEVKENTLKMLLENTYDPDKTNILEQYGGVGLENVRKRLAFAYKTDYELEIAETPNFKVRLAVPLFVAEERTNRFNSVEKTSNNLK